MTMKGIAKLKRKLTVALKNGIRNLVNFHVSCRKFENLHFGWNLLYKAYKDLDEKAEKSYLSWHRRVMQSLMKNWLFIWKMTWGIWWILTWAVGSLKICTLMGYFCWEYVIPLNLLFQRTLFLMFPYFRKYINPQVRNNKLVNSVFCHLWPSRLTSGIHPFIFL